MSKEISKLFIGSFYHSLKFNEGLEYFKLAALGIDHGGVIALFRSMDQDFSNEKERKDVSYEENIA